MTAVAPGPPSADADELLVRQTGILEQIAAGADLAGVLTGIAQTLEELLPGSRCSVLLLDREAGTLRHGAAPSLPSGYSARIDGMGIGAAAGSCGTAAWTGLPVVVPDVRRDARWLRYRHLADRFGLRACWSTPIRGRDGVCGTFAVYHPTVHRPTSRDEHVVGRLTHLASVAIDHDRLHGALRDSEERFRRAFDDNAVAMALTTTEGVVTRVNGATPALLGRPGPDLVGRPLDELVTPVHARPDRGAGYEATATTPDGRVLDLAVSLAPVRGPQGHPVALCVDVLDVTGHRAAERERHRRLEAELARHAAEVANAAKSDFVAALGHELRTPLQAVTGFTELLATLDLTPQRRTEALGHIRAAADHVLAVVDDVLDVARIEAGALPVSVEDVALGPVVDGVLAMLQPLAAAGGVGLRTDPAATALRVRADERRVTQVLINLVSNAVRYTRPDGTVHVGASTDGTRVRLTVADTGPGIAEEHLGRLFTAFDRLGRDRDEGVGLGLPLARGLTGAMGGVLEVRSEIGVGTTVTVDLPAAGVSPAGTGPACRP